jgi:hypothetical protein
MSFVFGAAGLVGTIWPSAVGLLAGRGPSWRAVTKKPSTTPTSTTSKAPANLSPALDESDFLEIFVMDAILIKRSAKVGIFLSNPRIRFSQYLSAELLQARRVNADNLAVLAGSANLIQNLLAHCRRTALRFRFA